MFVVGWQILEAGVLEIGKLDLGGWGGGGVGSLHQDLDAWQLSADFQWRLQGDSMFHLFNLFWRDPVEADKNVWI